MATGKPWQHLLWLLAKQEALVELGLAEAAADGAHGAVVRGAVIEAAELEELSLPGHVLRESFETGPDPEQRKNKTKKSKNMIGVVLGSMTNERPNLKLAWGRVVT